MGLCFDSADSPWTFYGCCWDARFFFVIFFVCLSLDFAGAVTLHWSFNGFPSSFVLVSVSQTLVGLSFDVQWALMGISLDVDLAAWGFGLGA